MEVVVELALIDQLWVFSIDGLYLHCHLEVGLGIDGLIDLTEGALIDLPDHFEILTHLLKHLRHWNKYYMPLSLALPFLCRGKDGY